MKNYVKKHKGRDVPDGAAHYNDKNRCFYNKDKTRYYNTECVGNGWTDLNFKAYAENSTELPEQDLPNWDDQPKEGDVWIEVNQGGFSAGWYRREGDLYISCDGFVDFAVETAEDEFVINKRPIAIDKEWLPVVGEEFEFNYGPEHERNHWQKSKLIAITDRFFIYTQEDLAEEEVDQIESVKFRPLKTAEEVMREMFILDCFNATPLGKTDSYTEMFGNMFDLGFTAPKGEG